MFRLQRAAGFTPVVPYVSLQLADEHVHDFHATMLHCLGIEHTKLIYRFEGRDYRLTDVAGKLVEKLLA